MAAGAAESKVCLRVQSMIYVQLTMLFNVSYLLLFKTMIKVRL